MKPMLRIELCIGNSLECQLRYRLICLMRGLSQVRWSSKLFQRSIACGS